MGNSVDFRKLAVDLRGQLTAAQTELAALREALATARQVIELQREGLLEKGGVLRKQLAAAEQRNADCVAKLELAASMMDDDERGNRFAEVCRIAIAALNKPEEAK